GFISVASAQSFPLKFDSQASTNSTEVIIGKTQVRYLAVINQTATVYYLKLYDVAAAPTCSTTSPVVFKAPLPASASNPTPIIRNLPDGIQFQNGVGFRLTGSLADSDTTNAATGVVINFGVKQ